MAGQCVPSIGAVSSAQCTGSGPPVELGGVSAGCVAQTTFSWALCSCLDVQGEDTLLTDAYDSQQGPYQPGGLGGGVGANGKLSTTDNVSVWGALWIAAQQGLSATAQVDVKQETHIGGPVSANDTMTLEGNAYVNGGLATVSTIAVKKTLYVPASATLSGVTYGSIVRGPVNVPPPCDCSPQSLLPIASWVAAARPPNNDNAAINLDPNVLAAGRQDPGRIDLPCGRFYLTGIQSNAPVTIAAHGNTALFIDGDVSPNSTLAFVADPTAQLDVVVGGTITTTGSLQIGSPSYPALSRTYVGGSASGSSLSITANWQIGGNVYAAYGAVSFESPYTMYGSLVAGDFSHTNTAAIHFDRAVLSGGLCPPASGADGGVPTCGSCKDCGNQACVSGTCGACTSSDQCCPPLVCQGGSCVVVPLQ